jgi:hypothetical protein
MNNLLFVNEETFVSDFLEELMEKVCVFKSVRIYIQNGFGVDSEIIYNVIEELSSGGAIIDFVVFGEFTGDELYLPLKCYKNKLSNVLVLDDAVLHITEDSSFQLILDEIGFDDDDEVIYADRLKEYFTNDFICPTEYREG